MDEELILLLMLVGTTTIVGIIIGLFGKDILKWMEWILT